MAARIPVQRRPRGDALCRLIAKRAGVAPSRVSVVRGEQARQKLVAVEGLEEPALLAALGGRTRGSRG